MASATGDVAESGRMGARNAAQVSPLWRILILIVGLFALAHDVHGAWDDWNGRPDRGTLGFVIHITGPDGFNSIVGAAPGSSAAALGLRKGDELRCDRGMDCQRVLRIGERVGVTLRRGGALSHHEIAAGPRRADAGFSAHLAGEILVYGARIATCLIGLFVMLRGGRRATNVIFGAALVALGMGDTLPATIAESDPRVFPLFSCLMAAVYEAAPLLFLAFAVAARWETLGKVSRAWRIIILAYAAAIAAWTFHIVLWAVAGRGSIRLTMLQDFELQTGLWTFGYLAAFPVLGLAWRESRGQDRTRYAYMLAAGALLTASWFVVTNLVYLAGNDWSPSNPLILFSVIGVAAGAGAFTYAVARHRVIDLGFAVNRTLVYAVVSAVLLAAFGLIEWAADHFVPIEGREKNALVDAAVAVGVFLAFHRVRDGVEHVIEGLFFRRWQRAEADLRRFVKEAAFVVQSSALTPAFVRALSDYTEGAEAAVYLADGLRYRRSAGEVAGAPAVLDADLPALVRVRSEPKAIEVQDGALAGCLIAPMVNRNEVIGVALVGLKPTGHAYRPDEIELIGWATRQVGLDLHTLKMEQLEAENAQIATLRTEIATLRSLIPQRA